MDITYTKTPEISFKRIVHLQVITAKQNRISM